MRKCTFICLRTRAASSVQKYFETTDLVDTDRHAISHLSESMWTSHFEKSYFRSSSPEKVIESRFSFLISCSYFNICNPEHEISATLTKTAKWFLSKFKKLKLAKFYVFGKQYELCRKQAGPSSAWAGAKSLFLVLSSCYRTLVMDLNAALDTTRLDKQICF